MAKYSNTLDDQWKILMTDRLYVIWYCCTYLFVFRKVKEESLQTGHSIPGRSLGQRRYVHLSGRGNASLVWIFNPFYPEASADELQPVPDHFHKINLSPLKNDKPSFKMDTTLLFLNQFLNILYHKKVDKINYQDTLTNSWFDYIYYMWRMAKHAQ